MKKSINKTFCDARKDRGNVLSWGSAFRNRCVLSVVWKKCGYGLGMETSMVDGQMEHPVAAWSCCGLRSSSGVWIVTVFLFCGLQALPLFVYPVMIPSSQ